MSNKRFRIKNGSLPTIVERATENRTAPGAHYSSSTAIRDDWLWAAASPTDRTLPTKHADLLSETKASGTIHTRRFINHIQRHYGNQHVQRVFDIARKDLGRSSVHTEQQAHSVDTAKVGALCQAKQNKTVLSHPAVVSGAFIQRVPTPAPRDRVIVPRGVIAIIGERINRALDRLARLAGSGTFAPWIVPVLRRLASSLTYRDRNGNDHNGSELEVGLRGRGRPFRLRLVIDDEPNPHQRGYFSPDGNRGRIGLNMQALRRSGAHTTAGDNLMALDEAQLAEILYHEAIHMFRYWQVHLRGARLPFSRSERATLSLALFRGPRGEIAIIQRNLTTVIAEVNRARQAVRGAQKLPANAARTFAESLAEEAMIRGESRYMTFLSRRREQQARGHQMGLMAEAGRSFGEQAADYLFESGEMLNTRDRAALTGDGREAVTRIRRLLGEIAHHHLRARWGVRPTETQIHG